VTERFTIGPPADDAENEKYLAVAAGAFSTPDDPNVRRWFEKSDRANFRVARHGADVVGGLYLIPMGQWFGGRVVPMTGVAGVCVAPEHRSRGAAGAMMRAAVVELRKAGVPLSALYPATQAVYRAAGFERAGAEYRIALKTREIDVIDRTLALRAATASDEPAMRANYDRRARACAGNLDRPQEIWDGILRPTVGVSQAYLVDGPAGVEGHVVCQKKMQPDGEAKLWCPDVVAATPGAARRIATFFADHKSMVHEVGWRGSSGDPVLAVLREQSAVHARLWDWFMLRIVDVAKAIEFRGFAPEIRGEVHLDVVADDVLTANVGRWLVRVEGGAASVERGGRGDVRCSIQGLAPLYTGFQSAAELRASGFVDGDDATLAAAAAVFAGPSPWMADHF
jgi:predicted acetyltransferase